jgi:hypothetical protein
MKSYTYGLAKTEWNQGNKILVLFTYSFQAPLALLVLTDKRFLSMFELVLKFSAEVVECAVLYS